MSRPRWVVTEKNLRKSSAETCRPYQPPEEKTSARLARFRPRRYSRVTLGTWPTPPSFGRVPLRGRVLWMRKFTLFVVAAGTLAVTLVAIASASHSTSRSAAITPTAEKAYPWLAPGVTPAGTAENNWAYPRADYMGTNYSMLKQINTGNVGNLKMAWQKSFMGPALASTVQGAPIVVSGKGKNLPIESGTMLLSTNKGAVALNPVTGETLWSYVGPGAPNGALAT